MRPSALGNVRAARIALLLAVSLASACASDSGDGGAPSATRVGSLALGAFRVSGAADLVVAWGQPTYNTVALRLLRQDSADADLLLDVATLTPPSSMGFDQAGLSVNEQWVTVAGGPSANWVQFVRAEGPYGSPATIWVPASAERATTWNDRLVVASSTKLSLYDVTTPASPALLDTFDLDAPTTAIVAVGNGVFVFTRTGYGYVDLIGGTYVETASAELKAVTAANAIGGKLYVGGPSKYAGHYRIGRLDPSTAPLATVEVANDRILDGNASGSNIADFSFDPVRAEYLLLAETGVLNPYAPPADASSALLRYVERGGAIVEAGSVTLDRGACTTLYCMYSSDGTARLHAFNGRAYVVLVQGGSEPLHAYRLP